MKARVGRFTDIVLRGLAAIRCCSTPRFFSSISGPRRCPSASRIWRFPCRSSQRIFSDRCEAVYSTGPLAPAVAGSMAIPGLIRPVETDGRVLIDGGAVNPLPYDVLFGPRISSLRSTSLSAGPREATKSDAVRGDVRRGSNHARRHYRAKAEAAAARHSRAADGRAVPRARFFPGRANPARRRVRPRKRSSESSPRNSRRSNESAPGWICAPRCNSSPVIAALPARCASRMRIAPTPQAIVGASSISVSRGAGGLDGRHAKKFHALRPAAKIDLGIGAGLGRKPMDMIAQTSASSRQSIARLALVDLVRVGRAFRALLAKDQRLLAPKPAARAP